MNYDRISQLYFDNLLQSTLMPVKLVMMLVLLLEIMLMVFLQWPQDNGQLKSPKYPVHLIY